MTNFEKTQLIYKSLGYNYESVHKSLVVFKTIPKRNFVPHVRTIQSRKHKSEIFVFYPQHSVQVVIMDLFESMFVLKSKKILWNGNITVDKIMNTNSCYQILPNLELIN